MLTKLKLITLFLLTFTLPDDLYSDSLNAVKVFPSPLFLYGKTVKFDVYRDGQKVGFHTIKFSKKGKNLKVSCTFQLKINLLFFTAYYFNYQSDAIWENEKLKTIKVHVDDDGETIFIEAIKVDDGMSIKKNSKTTYTGPSIFPTNHWNFKVLKAKKILNTITGEINNVSIIKGGKELVKTERGEIQAMRYIYSGDLETEVWYDEKGRWVKMKFKGRDGSEITYQCNKCQGPNRNGK